VPGNSLIAGRKYSFTALSKLPPRRRLGCALHLSRQKEASTFRASFLFSSIPRAFLFCVLVRHGISFETPAICSHRDKRICAARRWGPLPLSTNLFVTMRSEEHTSELQSRGHLVCRLLLEKKKYYSS